MIQELFPQVGLARFREQFWPHRSVHGDATKLRAILSPELLDSLVLQKILARRSDPVQVWGPTGSKRCSAGEAMDDFGAGLAVYVPHVENDLPALGPMLRELESELDVPAGSGHCSIFASPKDGFVLPHCDHDFGFNVLVYGTKRWRVSHQGVVPDPVGGHQIGREPSSAYAACGGHVPPAQMPDGDEFVARSPSCVFLPRGVWHTTTATEESLSLDFALEPPLRLDYVLGVLRPVLLAKASLRASVDRSLSAWLAAEGEGLIRGISRLIGAGEAIDPPALPRIQTLVDGMLVLVPEESSAPDRCLRAMFFSKDQLRTTVVLRGPACDAFSSWFESRRTTLQRMTVSDALDYIRRQQVMN